MGLPNFSFGGKGLASHELALWACFSLVLCITLAALGPWMFDRFPWIPLKEVYWSFLPLLCMLRPSEICVDFSRRHSVKTSPLKQRHITSVGAIHWHYCGLLRVPSDRFWCSQFKPLFIRKTDAIRLSIVYRLFPHPLPILFPNPSPFSSSSLLLSSVPFAKWADVAMFAISKPVGYWDKQYTVLRQRTFARSI